MIDCPCCNQPVAVPTLDVVVQRYGVPPMEARILGAIWKGRGTPVITSRVFDAMYADDADGGPSPSKMYAAFKVALCHLRQRLEGSGVSIVSAGYARGWKLALSPAEGSGHRSLTA